MIFRCFLLAVLATPSMFAGEPGIPIGVQFRLPINNSAGRTVQARAHVTADKSLHLLFADGDDVAELVYGLTRQDAGPAPAPLPTPKPTPTPTPPQPTPGPVTVGPLHVLFLYDAQEIHKAPPEQAAILTAKTVRDYLSAKCAKDEGTPAYRFLTDDSDVSRLSDDWRAVFTDAKIDPATNKPRPLPWLTVTNGKDWYRGPWPANAAATVELLTKYGGK